MGNKCCKMSIAEVNTTTNTNMPYVGISLREEYNEKRKIKEHLEKFNKIEEMVNNIYKIAVEQDIPPSKHSPVASISTQTLQTLEDDFQKLVITVFVNKKQEINFRILVDK